VVRGRCCGLTPRLDHERDRGFAIVVVVALLAVAFVLAAAVTLETSRKLAMVRMTESEVNATLLARSGLERGLVELASDLAGYGGIPITEVSPRHVYLIDPPLRSNNHIELVSTGVANGIARQIRMTVGLDAGISGVFDKAVYAGNIPPDPADRSNPPAENLTYSLEFAGVGEQGDIITGDVYSGNDVSVEQDAIIAPAVEETYTDENGNGFYDRGDYLSLDINGNGMFDPDASEAFVDANGNGLYDEGEQFDDVNENGQYDSQERFIDFDHDGVFDLPEPFNDTNGNGRFEYGIEAVGDVDYPGEPAAGGGDPMLMPPNLVGAGYADTADVNVSARFAGISSGTLPESDAAHIFVKNPHDGRDYAVNRRFELNGQLIDPDDYFLEDPYEPIHIGDQQSSANPTLISISSESAGHEEGNNKVYFVDGNLYLHNRHLYTFQLDYPNSDGIRLTIVARGNIILSDNFFYRNMNKDQVAFIAMRREDDPKGEISGNLYIGDEEFGTVAFLNALLYAENNFYDNNLDEEGSKHFDIYGNMTAGNQVRINRDYVIPGHYEWRRVNGEWMKVWITEEERHSSMRVIFDPRYIDGPNGRERLAPGLPPGPRRDFSMSIRVASTQHIGRVDVPDEYYALYGLE